MTIEWRRGDMFASGAEALVCAANAKGILGAGQALEVKKRFPKQTGGFVGMANSGQLTAGYGGTGYASLSTAEAHLRAHRVAHTDPLILFACTKSEPSRQSSVPIIKTCAIQLSDVAMALELSSVALPALGCGLGGLRWADVRPVIQDQLERAPGVRWMVYEPLDELRIAIADALAIHIGRSGLRANRWPTKSDVGNRPVRVYLAHGVDVPLGWIEIDPLLRISVGAPGRRKPDVPAAWVQDAERIRDELSTEFG